jgi:hypothetical protein
MNSALAAAEKVDAIERNSRFLGAEAPRNDKNKGLTTAHLKVRPFKAACNPTFSAASEAVPLQSYRNR